LRFSSSSGRRFSSSPLSCTGCSGRLSHILPTLAARRRDHERRCTGRPLTSAPLVARIAWYALSGLPSWPYQIVWCCSSSAPVGKELPNYRDRDERLPEVGPPPQQNCFAED